MYFPESQIITNLYTNGGELVYLLSKQDYKGYYFKTLSGKYYTGKNQNDGPNVELIFQPIPVTTNFSTPQPTIPKSIPLQSLDSPKLLPYYLPQLPTPQDYQIGEFRRYFCKKVNQIQYLEINQEQYTLLITQDPQIEYSLFIPFFIDWQLTGDKQQVTQVNKNSTELISFKNKLPMLPEYLQFNWTKYYQ